MVLLASATSLLCVGLVGCDQGHQDDQPPQGEAVGGTPVHVIGQNFGNTPLSTSAFPSDGVLRITFDRYLLPVTVTRQSFVLSDSSGNVLSSVVDYDPVARVVSLSNPGGAGQPCWLNPNASYTVSLGIPSGESDTGGLRAIDGATLTAPQLLGFIAPATAAVACPAGGVATPTANFCSDVLPIFQSRCSAPNCHGSPTMVGVSPVFPAGGMSAPAAGLILDEPYAFMNTAGLSPGSSGIPAHGDNTGPENIPEPPGPIFAVDMPIVDPSGDPANSWLLYKLLLAVPSATDDPTLDCAACVPTTCNAKGVTCGMTDDGCGNLLDCDKTGGPGGSPGGCTGMATCGGGTPGQCGLGTCTPLTCEKLGYTCGSAGDGCGKVLTCGSCTDGFVCVGGKTCEDPGTLAPFAAGPNAGPAAGNTAWNSSSATERTVLANYILGREMPYPAYPGMGDPVGADASSGGNAPLSFDELERVRAWLNNPVVPTSCDYCAVPTTVVTDAGVDAPSDASVDAMGDAKGDATTDAHGD